MIFSATVYRLMGAASLAVLVANVGKHGWQWGSVGTGSLLTILMFSLAVSPERRTVGWEIRYLVAVAAVVTLAARRFLF